MDDPADFRALMEPVARRFFGNPTSINKGGRELRFGSHGSLSIDLDTGTWYDHEAGEGGGVLALIKRQIGMLAPEAMKWLERNGFLPRRPHGGSASQIYRYHDENGSLLFEVLRFAGHKFAQRAPDPERPGEYLKDEKTGKLTVKGVKQVPYRLPELKQAISEGKTIYYAEGEKDADRLWSHGFPATTNAMGASNHKWLSDLAGYFQDADVVVTPDYDLPGQQHALRVAKTISGTAKRIRLVDWEKAWPEVKLKDDVSDWFDNGGNAEQLRAIVEALAEWKPPARSKVVQLRPVDRPPWFDRLRKGARGRILTDLHNVMIALLAEPSLADCFAYDEMLQMPMLMQNPPVLRENGLVRLVPRKVTDRDVSRLQEWLQHNGLSSVGFDTVNQAVEDRADERPFHSIRNWLNALTPAPAREIDSWLHDYFGCEESEYHTKIGRMFLIAMVARIYEPGCQADYMLVLEGEQGEVKSQACRVLAGDYFSNSLPEINADPVRLSMHLRGKWLVEIAELSAFSRADTELLKSFLTRQVEQYIPKYGRRERNEPRQCLFIGTTNRDDYIKDETGGRRFWPVKCGTIDKDGLRCARTQLFAEAVELYRNGEPWWPERDFEKKTIVPHQEKRQFVDAWLPVVKEWLDRQLAQEFSLMEVAQGALEFKKDRLGTIEQRRLAAVLRLCDWKDDHNRYGNKWHRCQANGCEPSEPM